MKIYILKATIPFNEVNGKKTIFCKTAFQDPKHLEAFKPMFKQACEPRNDDLLTWNVENAEFDTMEFTLFETEKL